jgi:hypothetical protein
MAAGDSKPVEERLLTTLMSNTEALTNLNATVSNHDREYVEGKKAAREHANNVAAKIDNLDRSISEMRLATEKAESARQAELKRIYDILGEERKDRRQAVTEGREGTKDEREFIRQLIKEELGERRSDRADNRHLVKTVSAEIWKAGGKYIVAGVVLLILALVMKATGLSLVEIVGFTGK